MKSKKIIFVSLILISLTALLFTGCTPAAEKKDDSKTEIPNPMVEQPSLEAIKEAIGFSFESLPTGITDVKYFTIADNLAQADFTLDGVTYTARKTDSGMENIAGVYTQFSNSQTKTTTAGAAVLFQYDEGKAGLATWTAGTYGYSVYCEDGFDLAGMEVVVNGVF